MDPQSRLENIFSDNYWIAKFLTYFYSLFYDNFCVIKVIKIYMIHVIV